MRLGLRGARGVIMSDKRDRHSDRGQLSRLTNYQETQTNRVTATLGGGMAVGEGGGVV